MLGGLGMPELIVILVIVMVIFGAGKLPEIGSNLGRSITGFKKAMGEAKEELDPNAKQVDGKNNPAQ